jgi:hypothetical protein
VIAWFVFLIFIAFYAGIATFQNYINNVFLWLLSGMVFGLPQAAGRSEGADRTTVTSERG